MEKKRVSPYLHIFEEYAGSHLCVYVSLMSPLSLLIRITR